MLPLAAVAAVLVQVVAPTSYLSRPGTPNVTLEWFTSPVDHFDFVNDGTTFQQRVFTYDKFWKKNTGAIWFYCGNEANVELYVNATGLMWENAEAAGALLVFAEHRYYGKSLLFPGDPGKLPPAKMKWLTMEQALADYAGIIKGLQIKYGTVAPVVAFGGSYGGMLAAWLRMKYPASVVGAVAASAPILAFGQEYDTNSFWRVVTRDATPAAGAAAGCDSAVRKTWPLIASLGTTAAGRKTLTNAFRLCEPIKTSGDAERLAMMAVNAWDVMSMGNFPFPSNYLVYQDTGNPAVVMPAFPVRVACDALVGTHPTGVDLLYRMRDAIAVLYNVTASKRCFSVPADPNYDGIWDYQWCTELLPQETYFSLDGTRDMFWKHPMNMSAINIHCQKKYGVTPRADWIVTEFGGKAGVASASNIVFSNGLLDPWSSGGVGVAEASAAESRVASLGVDGTVKAVVIDLGAHHLDLMFSDPADPECVKAARKVELAEIAKWTAKKDEYLLPI